MSNANNEWSPKHPEDKIVLTASFEKALPPNLTIASAVWSATPAGLVFSGVCDVATHPLAKQRVEGGDPGVVYTIKIKATLSDSQVIVGTKRLVMLQA